MDPYQILGVDRNASLKVIKSAYRKLAHLHHPDLHQDDASAESTMVEINEAYAILSNAVSRAEYDRQNPVASNIYTYYAQKSSKPASKSPHKRKTNTNIEKEKEFLAIMKFLEVEFEHKKQIQELLDELATNSLNKSISADDYISYYSLINDEVKDCINKINGIIAVAKKKNINDISSYTSMAKRIISELQALMADTPTDISTAFYKEETKQLNIKIVKWCNSLKSKIGIFCYNLLDKVWGFSSDEAFKKYIRQYNSKLSNFKKELEWVCQTAAERNIKIPDFSITSYAFSFNSLDEIAKFLSSIEPISDNLSLQDLRKDFWEKKCRYSIDENGDRHLSSIYTYDYYKGIFICPPDIKYVDDTACNNCLLDGIEIPFSYIRDSIKLSPRFKTLRIVFDDTIKEVDISSYNKNYDVMLKKENDFLLLITRDFNDIALNPFIVITKNQTYYYSEKDFSNLIIPDNFNYFSSKQYWHNYYLAKDFSNVKPIELYIHYWALQKSKLPDLVIVFSLPPDNNVIKTWINMDKRNFEEVFEKTPTSYLPRLIRLYIALGALKDDFCHNQAEYLIKKIDVTKMYRSRYERYYSEQLKAKSDPIMNVPSDVVNFVQENINDTTFMPYVYLFLEGHQMFISEAKKTNTGLSVNFIISHAAKYVFHRLLPYDDFVKELFEREEQISENEVIDKIASIYSIILQKGINVSSKNIVTTVDTTSNNSMHYEYYDLSKLDTYLDLKRYFSQGNKSLYKDFAGEAINVFLSDNTHAIKIVNNNGDIICQVILTLFSEGELFADIINSNSKNESDLITAAITISRALLEQMKINSKKVTGLSIGMREAATTSRYNGWHKILEKADDFDFTSIEWVKFEYVFKNTYMSVGNKVFRTRFKVAGKLQDLPQISITPYEHKPTRRRSVWHW